MANRRPQIEQSRVHLEQVHMRSVEARSQRRHDLLRQRRDLVEGLRKSPESQGGSDGHGH